MPTKKISDASIKALERLINNYRFIYTVIMSAPLIVALENFTISSDKTHGVKSLKYLSQFKPEDILMFIVFLSIQPRFYLGDLRYLDIKYLQSPNDKAYQQRYSPISRAIDFTSLIIHAVFFYFLAASLNDFVLFYKIFTLILFLNAAWLLFVYLLTDRGNEVRLETKSTIRWTVNNIIFAMILITYYSFSNGLTSHYAFTFFFVVAILNAVADYALTWKMYFPKIEETLIEDAPTKN